MGLSTSNLPTGGGMAKTISPGNHTLKINNIYLEDFKFIAGAKHLMMNVETEPIDGFEGFMKDKDDSSLGNYEGQIGRVKAGQYAFADGKTKSGVEIFRDKSVLMFMNTLCRNLGISDWFNAQDDKHNTIEEFIDAFNETAPYQDVYMDFCVAGKEYESKSGYTNYDMWLPKGSKNGYAMTVVESPTLLKYNEAIHLKKIIVENLDNGFENIPTSEGAGKTASDFTLD